MFEEWLAEEPDNPIARHMIAACSGRTFRPGHRTPSSKRPSTVSPAASKPSSPNWLYRALALVAAMLAGTDAEASKSLDVLDAGCGAGLCGPLIAPCARRLVGVDLSGRMLAQAQDKNVYDELIQRELTSYLRDSPAVFDAIVSADTLVYFGLPRRGCGRSPCLAARRPADLHGGRNDWRRRRYRLLHQPERALQPHASVRRARADGGQPPAGDHPDGTCGLKPASRFRDWWWARGNTPDTDGSGSFAVASADV